MAVALYFDVNVDHAIANQLRLRGVDVITAQEDRANQFADDLLLQRSTQLSRPLVTHDIRLNAMAQSWQSKGIPFFGLIFAQMMHVSIGQCVKDLEIIAKATDPDDWSSTVIRLPL